jgi:hypothetical protein
MRKRRFYHFTGNADFPWRKLAYYVNLRLLKQVKKSSYNNENKPVRCLIADDTDLPKRGRCFELLSRSYSHVTNTFNYGFKGLFFGYHDGTSFFGLDFSLLGEKGNDQNKPFGLTKKQQKARYSKNATQIRQANSVKTNILRQKTKC